MPQLPLMSGQDAVKIFNKFGYTIDRQKGSHAILVKDGCHHLSIPLHKELDRFTLKSIIKVAEISADDFNEKYNEL